MLSKLREFNRQYGLIRTGDTVICAVSGGADSMALLWALYLLREKLDIRLQAAHFNHHLRGEESDREEAFVRDFCRRYEIPLSVGSGDVIPGKKGLEAAAREARYAYFRTLSGKIATAHTADDNAETVLMHLIRGTGLKGLGAIAPVNGYLIRPLLSVTRQDVLDFLSEYHIPHMEDSSNQGDDFLRNRIRHHVIPLLQQENPCFCVNTSAMALRLRQDEQTLTKFAEAQPAGVSALRELEPALRSRALEQLLKKCGVKEPDSHHIALAEELVFSEKASASANFPGGIILSRNYDLLEARTSVAPLETVSLEPGTEVKIPQLGLRVTCREAETITNSETVFTVYPQGKIVIRSRISGDEMTLPGGTKSLKKIFIDRKIPAHRRLQIPVLADDAGVLAVYGIGVNRARTAVALPAIQISLNPLCDREIDKTEE